MDRLARLLPSLKPEGSFLVSNPTNIRYLSGFTGSNSLLLVTHEGATLITDPRYKIQAAAEVSNCEILIATDIWASAIELINQEQLYVEEMHLTVNKLDLILSQKPILRIIKQKDLVEKLRILKDQDEIAVIKKACEISTHALDKLIDGRVAGLSEIEIATKLDRLMIDLGAQDRAFNTIVATGPNSAIPHHQPTERKIEVGDLLKIDFGAQWAGYKSDCTRTFVIGRPADWQVEIHEAVKSGQGSGREVSVPGTPISAVDQQVRKAIDEFGYADKFTHGLGHGVGLDIHEDPFLSAKLHDKITQNMVITVEPGIYLEQKGGVRIEDTGFVTESGYKVLTDFSYELIELT